MYKSISYAIYWILILLAPNMLFAQIKNTISQIMFDQYEIQFTMPHGFYEDFNENSYKETFKCGDGKITNAMFFRISSKDNDSIKISFSGIEARNEEKQIQKIRKYYKNYNPNTNYLNSINHKADTINRKIQFFDKQYLQEMYNADDGGTFIRDCYIPFLDKYYNHIVLFLAKKDLGHIEVTYFYNKDSNLEINDIIRGTAGLVKFKY